MVVSALEQDLGEFVNLRLKVTSEVTDVSSKDFEVQVITRKQRLATAIEESFFEQLVQMAKINCINEKEKNAIDLLSKSFLHYEIYKIRNSIAHPNRPFLETYWYRAAALATDPMCHVLNFERTIKNSKQAREGKLSDISEDWLAKLIWRLPNNLPVEFEFRETGIVGRNKEKRDLEKFLLKGKSQLIAVVAPGGIGKTAVTVSVLDDLSRNPETANDFAAIVYVTLKTEALTDYGIKRFRPDYIAGEFAEEVKKTILSVTQQRGKVREKTNSKFPDNFILCIDNIETILIEEPSLFHDFYDQLPSNCKVVVTSRVSVDAARSFPLRPLLPDDSKLLVRKYATHKGLSQIEEEDIEYIAENAGHNPLAIRLSLELQARGFDLKTAAHMAGRDITEFSFKNLLETLDQRVLELVEAILLKSGQNADELSMILDRDRDGLIEDINVLLKTSFIARKEGNVGDIYEVNRSIKDLLLVSHPNISIRLRIREKLQRLESADQETQEQQRRRGINEYNWIYIPRSVSAPLKNLLKDKAQVLDRRIRDFEAITEIYRELSEVKPMYDKIPVFNAYLGKCYERLASFDEAESAYSKAIEKSKGSVVYKVLLARFYHDSKRYEDAEEIYRNILDSGETQQSLPADFFSTILQGYFFSLIYQDKVDRVIEETESWRDQGECKVLYAMFRASAIKRKGENFDIDQKLVNLRESFSILNEVCSDSAAFPYSLKRVFDKNVDELNYCVNSAGFTFNKHRADECRAMLDVIERYMKLEGFFGESVSTLSLGLFEIGGDDNPVFYFPRFCAIAEETGQRNKTVDVVGDGYIKVKISNIPKADFGFPRYLFGTNDEGLDYFLHRSRVQRSSGVQWAALVLGSEVLVLPDISDKRPGQAIPVSDIRLAD